MNAKILLLAIFITALGSCTTAYKSSQTPDDVYYSPAPPREEEVKSEDKEERKDAVYNESDEDRDIRLKIRNRRWRNNSDYDYSYQPYAHNNTCCCSYSYHPTGYYYYNDPKTKTKVTYYPRKFNFNTRNTTAAGTTNPKSGNTPKQSSLGSAIRKVLRTTSTESKSDNSTPARTFDKPSSNSNSNNSSSSSSSSSSSGSSGSAPVRTFNK